MIAEQPCHADANYSIAPVNAGLTASLNRKPRHLQQFNRFILTTGMKALLRLTTAIEVTALTASNIEATTLPPNIQEINSPRYTDYKYTYLQLFKTNE